MGVGLGSEGVFKKFPLNTGCRVWQPALPYALSFGWLPPAPEALLAWVSLTGTKSPPVSPPGALKHEDPRQRHDGPQKEGAV